MRAQVPARRLAADPIDDDTVLTLLDLASRAGAGNRWRCEFVVVRDPDVRHQLARIYRQGWSIYRRVLRTRSGDDAELEARQWEADHFEDVPGDDRRLRPGPAAACSRRSGAAAFYGAAFPAVQNLLLAAAALGLGGARHHPRALVALGGAPDARRSPARHAGRGRAARAAARRPVAPPPVAAAREPRAPRPVRAPAVSGQRPPVIRDVAL